LNSISREIYLRPAEANFSHGTLLELSWDRKIAQIIEEATGCPCMPDQIRESQSIRINRCYVRKREIEDVACTEEIEDGT
jgi:hypothetical protein